MHDRGRVGGNRHPQVEAAVASLPVAADEAARACIVGPYPFERATVGIALRRGYSRSDDDPTVSRLERVDPGEHAEGPLHHRAEGVVAEAVHRGIVLASHPFEAVIFREAVPAFPHARRALLHLVAPTRKPAALEKPAGEVVVAVRREHRQERLRAQKAGGHDAATSLHEVRQLSRDRRHVPFWHDERVERQAAGGLRGNRYRAILVQVFSPE